MTHSSRIKSCAAAWAFVATVTAVDIDWALRYQDTAGSWESNPAMLWVMNAYGVTAAAAIRAGTVALAGVLALCAPWRCQLPATCLATAAHIYLATAYALILWGPREIVGL